MKMKSKFIPIAVFLAFFVILCGFLHNKPTTLEAFSVTGAFCVSGLALCYAILEFEHHKKNDKTTLLCQYLHRYATDDNIKQIIEYVNNTASLDKNGNIIGIDNNKLAEFSKSFSLPTQREKEMFMHFYEELQMLIDCNMVEGDVAIDLLGYYCGIFHRIKEFHQDITDYDDEKYWEKYLRFAKSSSDYFLCQEQTD